MEEVESIDDLAARVMALVADVRAHGVEVEEGYTVEKLLRAVSPKFDQIACAIEVLCDLKSMTVEDLVDRLKAYEIRLQDQGLMTQAEWEAEMKKRDGEAGRGRGGRGKGIGCGDGERCNVFGKKGRKFDKSKVRCYNCQDYGHFASECRKVLYKSV
uniref:CCHC-type domain-containing protein n=1 Tax=Arundo donax TaxID=35708 RepID=A0A0A8YGT6_ARUDO